MTPFLVKEAALCAFVAYLYRDSLSAGSVKSYLAAIRLAQISLGLGDPKIPDMPKLEYVIKGLRRKATGREVHPHLPITPTILHKLKNVWEQLPSRKDAVMLWGAACLCFFCFLRTGEVVVPSGHRVRPTCALSFQDVNVDNRQNPKWLEVHIKASKTDPFRCGVTIYVGATGKWLCPVASVLSYMAQRGNKTGSLFMFRDGFPLTRPRFVTALWEALRKAGYGDKKYAGLGFRI